MIIMDVIEVSEAERMLHTPEAGQCIITTDESKLFLGDGETVGGVVTGRDAQRLSVQLEEMGVFETLESHYVIADQDDLDSTISSHWLITQADDPTPMNGMSELPGPDDGEVGDIVFVY